MTEIAQHSAECRRCHVALSEGHNWERCNRKWKNNICRDCRRATQRAHYYRFREDRLAAQKLRQRGVRLETIAAYGGVCACCGEAGEPFLTIDHIYNDGTQHRTQENLHGGATLYRWLRKQGFPKDRFQLLCFNCNHAKHNNRGSCPHREAIS